MAVRCSKCGEQLLGSVNRCWQCGQSFAGEATSSEIPPIRVPPVVSDTAVDGPDAAPQFGAGSRCSGATRTHCKAGLPGKCIPRELRDLFGSRRRNDVPWVVLNVLGGNSGDDWCLAGSQRFMVASPDNRSCRDFSLLVGICKCDNASVNRALPSTSTAAARNLGRILTAFFHQPRSFAACRPVFACRNVSIP